MYKILIVDDEKDIVSFLKEYFEGENYKVITAYNGAEAVEQSKQAPDVILLDINMPDIDGLEVCKKIRNQVDCPIIFLTARVQDTDKIEGFSVGGDDYVIKPFSVEVLGSRVASHLRRESRKNNNSVRKSFKDIVIDYSEYVVYSGDEVIPFAKKEFDIIKLLSINTGQVFDKERIYEKVWGYDAEGESSAVTEHIKRIRAKCSKYSDEKYIETVWGVGYKWLK